MGLIQIIIHQIAPIMLTIYLEKCIYICTQVSINTMTVFDSSTTRIAINLNTHSINNSNPIAGSNK